MCHRFLSSPNCLLLLLAIDRDLAEKVRLEGCPCGGRLHAANYPRKPRGGPSFPDSTFSLRLTFCCDVDGCRCRSTPPSVRFLGRRICLGVMVVLITALRQGPSPKGSVLLQKRFGADRRTIVRWQAWWKDAFPRTRFWKVARARCIVRLRQDCMTPGAAGAYSGGHTLRRTMHAAAEASRRSLCRL